MTDKILKTSKVPNLRFTGFEDNWEEMTLGTCSNSLDYGMNASACEFDGLNKYIRITDIDESSSRYKSESPVSPTGELVDKYLVEENDILFARTGASTGKTYLYNPKVQKTGIVYHPQRIKVSIVRRVKVNHLQRMKVNH